MLLVVIERTVRELYASAKKQILSVLDVTEFAEQ
jgi:hypothetical protein